jgi:DNA-binding Xre family transcriptional regulator
MNTAGGDGIETEWRKLNIAMANTCMTINELAEKADLGTDTLAKLKRGREAQPRTIGKLARALGVEVTELIEQEG